MEGESDHITQVPNDTIARVVVVYNLPPNDGVDARRFDAAISQDVGDMSVCFGDPATSLNDAHQRRRKLVTPVGRDAEVEDDSLARGALDEKAPARIFRHNLEPFNIGSEEDLGGEADESACRIDDTHAGYGSGGDGNPWLNSHQIGGSAVIGQRQKQKQKQSRSQLQCDASFDTKAV